jgi:hypothetical protein
MVMQNLQKRWKTCNIESYLLPKTEAVHERERHKHKVEGILSGRFCFKNFKLKITTKLALSIDTFIFLLDLEILFIANHQNNRVFAVFKGEIRKCLGYFSQRRRCYINRLQLRKLGHIREHINSSGEKQYLQ